MLKRSLQIMFVALFGAVMGIVSTQSASALSPTVYNQPGDHLVNGRYWKTECSKYSSDVVRCSTKIWAKLLQPQRLGSQQPDLPSLQQGVLGAQPLGREGLMDCQGRTPVEDRMQHQGHW